MTIIPDEIKLQKRVLFRVTMTKEALEEVETYCQWRGISKRHFSEHAMKYVFCEDKNWLAYKGCHNASMQSQPVDLAQHKLNSDI